MEKKQELSDRFRSCSAPAIRVAFFDVRGMSAAISDERRWILYVAGGKGPRTVVLFSHWYGMALSFWFAGGTSEVMTLSFCWPFQAVLSHTE